MTFKLAFKHLFSKPFLSLFTLFGVVCALTVLGSFWTVVENLERVRVTQPGDTSLSEAPGLTLFVDAKTPVAEMELLKTKLQIDKRFNQLKTVNPEEALAALEQQIPEALRGTLAEAFSGETLPIALKLSFSAQALEQKEYTNLISEMRSLPNVLDVYDGQNLFPLKEAALSPKVFSWANTLLGLVFAIVALLVSQLVRIAFETLRPEVETMKVLGASRFWIFKPLFIEGLLFGIAGSIVSLLCLAVIVNVFLPKFAGAFLPNGLEIQSLSFSGAVGLVGLGLLASVVGAFFTWPLINQAPKEI